MLKICIWMDVPSHYQSAFFKAIRARDDIDLQVCYTNRVADRRIAQGWNDDHALEPFEQCCAGLREPAEMVALVPEWEERIHVISNYISRSVIRYFCARGVQWCHWSEMHGIRLAGLLGFRMNLYRLLEPLMLVLKWPDGRRIGTHALVAFGQGALAERAFRLMGVPRGKVANLYYAPEPLTPMSPCRQIEDFAKGRRVFLSVGALCRRKGIDLLLKAFAQADCNEWCLVLCGLDKSAGKYEALAKQLGIWDRVLFLGAWPVERIAEAYAAADVFVLASRFDGWGAVLNEAASLGLPLVATDLCGASRHVVMAGVNGCVARAGSVRSLKQALRFFVDHPDVLDRYGAASKQLYFKEFTPQRNAERLVETLSILGAADHA